MLCIVKIWKEKHLSRRRMHLVIQAIRHQGRPRPVPSIHHLARPYRTTSLIAKQVLFQTSASYRDPAVHLALSVESILPSSLADLARRVVPTATTKEVKLHERSESIGISTQSPTVTVPGLRKLPRTRQKQVAASTIPCRLETYKINCCK